MSATARSRSCSPRSASAPPAPPRRSARTGSRPRASAPAGSSSAARCWCSSRCSASGAALGRSPRAPADRSPRSRSATYQLAFFAAVADTGVAVGTIVALGSAPALAGALEWAVERRAPTRAWAMATALACAGVAMLALAGADATISLPGVGLALVAGASYAGYTLAAKRMLARGPRARDGDGGRVRPRRGRAAARCWSSPARAGSRRPAAPRSRCSSGIVPTALAYLLFARGLQAAERGRDRDADAGRAAHRRAAGRDRAERAAVRARGGRRGARSSAGCSCWPRPTCAAARLRSPRDARSRPSPPRCGRRSSRASARRARGWSSRS